MHFRHELDRRAPLSRARSSAARPTATTPTRGGASGACGPTLPRWSPTRRSGRRAPAIRPRSRRSSSSGSCAPRATQVTGRRPHVRERHHAGRGRPARATLHRRRQRGAGRRDLLPAPVGRRSVLCASARYRDPVAAPHSPVLSPGAARSHRNAPNSTTCAGSTCDHDGRGAPRGRQAQSSPLRSRQKARRTARQGGRRRQRPPPPERRRPTPSQPAPRRLAAPRRARASEGRPRPSGAEGHARQRPARRDERRPHLAHRRRRGHLRRRLAQRGARPLAASRTSSST